MWMLVLLAISCGDSIDSPHRRLALLLGEGPEAESSSGNGCLGRNFTKWKEGTHLKIIVSRPTVPPQDIALLSEAIPQIAYATAGKISAELRYSNETDPRPQENEITVALYDDPIAQGCVFPQGCAQATFHRNGEAFEITSGRFIGKVGQDPKATVHDVIGHLALGLCHVDANTPGGKNSLMAFGAKMFANDLPPKLTEQDLEAIRPVYESSLKAGAGRKEFSDLNL